MTDKKAPDTKGGYEPDSSDQGGPDTRSRYDQNPSMTFSYPELYKKGDRVYLKGARGYDANPYKIYAVLGDGKYELYRNGRIEKGQFEQENLRKTLP